VALLNKKVRESDKLIAIRADINNNFDIILQRMQQLSQYTKMNSEELNNQNILLNDIQESNQKIQAELQQNPIHLKSFDLYKKLSDNISTAATIKDSLFTTRFQIESLRSQLESCNKTNTTAVNKIKGRFAPINIMMKFSLKEKREKFLFFLALFLFTAGILCTAMFYNYGDGTA
jgi:chromosome segregation ATPase